MGVLLGTVGAAVALAVDDKVAGDKTSAILSASSRPIHSLCDAEKSLSARGSSSVVSIAHVVPVIMYNISAVCLVPSLPNTFVQPEVRHVLTGSGEHVPMFGPAP